MCPDACPASRRQVALLVAEFAPLDAELAAMSDAVARGEASLLNEDELDRLAVEIPEMRTRLGIRCACQTLLTQLLSSGEQMAENPARAWSAERFGFCCMCLDRCRCCACRDDQVFAGSGLSLVKVQLQLQEGIAKVSQC